jgi:hypothetical protein
LPRLSDITPSPRHYVTGSAGTSRPAGRRIDMGPFRGHFDHKEASMKLRALSYAVLVASVLGLAGCGSYYMVRDPATGMRYYTSDIDTPGSAGTLRFKDARTSRDITLQNSEVIEISKDEFNRQTGRY